MKRKLRLGTRRSLLARTQSQWIANEIQRRSPECEIELVGIETQGDRITDIPLSKIEGRDFFVAEIDQALKEKRVDFTVHSLKDLSVERPPEFKTAAIPPRKNPRDVILFSPEYPESEITLGTSSPRRIELIPPFLKDALPQPAPKIRCEEIRGNVNTRLARLHEPTGSKRRIDGLVLAFAGLARLWQDETARNEIKELLNGLRWMVMPLTVCPSAPGQGALAVECRSDDQDVISLISQLHCPQTQKEVDLERTVLKRHGGGCHQRFGVTSVSHSEVGEVLITKGRSFQDKSIDEVEWKTPPELEGDIAFDGSRWRNVLVKTENLPVNAVNTPAVFIAHSRALHESVQVSEKSRIWTSGVSSWNRLAKEGLWVEGCAEAMGFDHLRTLISEPLLQLPELREWTVLSHESAQADWKMEPVHFVASYRLRSRDPASAATVLRRAEKVYWSSYSQFELLKDYVAPDAHHACGPGHTFQKLKKESLKNLSAFPSVEKWREWIGETHVPYPEKTTTRSLDS